MGVVTRLLYRLVVSQVKGKHQNGRHPKEDAEPEGRD